MQTRPFGHTGLTVSALGFGAGRIGEAGQSQAEVDRLVHAALDAGVTLFDTAPGYGASEARLGQALQGRRSQVVISTKGGYGVAGVPDWTPACITAGIEQALHRLKTDHIDLFHLHSCPDEVLARGDLFEPLIKARSAGRIRAVAYSGEGEALTRAVGHEAIDAVQASVNLCDQASLGQALAQAHARGLGVIGKRPLANAFWRMGGRPAGDGGVYFDRANALGLFAGDFDDLVAEAGGWAALALRFAAWAPGVHAVIAGTRHLGHLHSNIKIMAKGPLPEAAIQRLRAAFKARGHGIWGGWI